MSDKQDGLKDKQFSRREFMKLMGTGTLFLGLGAFGISNFKNIREASAITEAAPPSNNTNTTRNDMGIQGSMIVHVVRFTLKPNAPKDQVDLAFEQLRNARAEKSRQSSYSVSGETLEESSITVPCI
jgi:hypothetical protein